MAAWTVVLRGVGHRTGRSLMVLLLAAVATAATVLAPAYSRAAQQSVLADRLATAPASATSLQVRSDPLAGEPPTLESTAEAKLELRLMLARQPGLDAALQRPVAGADIEIATRLGSAGAPPAGGGEQVVARLAYRDNVCARLRITAGTCARDTGSVIISARSAREYGLGVGDSMSVRGRALAGPGADDPSRQRSLTVVGLYEPVDEGDPYWGRGGYFAAGAAGAGGGAAGDLARIDAVFAGDEQDLTLPGALPSVHLDYQLRPEVIRLDDLPRLRAGLTGFTTSVNAAQLQLLTSLRAALDDIDTEASSLGRTIPIVAVPLVLVCWFVLFLLVAALAEERSPELALAKLRGFSPRQAARFGRGEALLLVLLAAPVGVLAGLVIVELAARTTLGPGVHVEARWPVGVAAVIAVVAGVAVVRLGSRTVLRRPALALLRRVPERERPRAGVAEAAAVTLAAASLVAALSDQTAPLALLAPALIAVVAGIVTARLLALWSRARVRRHARKGRLTGVLAHAQISRRRLGHRVILVVTVAVALLSFAATAWDVAAQARDDVAADTVGAHRVVSVGAADPVAFVAAVDAAVAGSEGSGGGGSGGGGSGGGATPAGNDSAMPVVRVSERYGDEVVQLLGVRTDQLADVAVWRGHGHDEVAGLASRLRPELAPALTVAGTVTVTATASGLTGQPGLAAIVASAANPARSVDLGQLVAGTRQYRSALPACATGATGSGGCRLIGLAITPARADGGLIAANLTITDLSTGTGALPAGFGEAGRWRVNQARAPRAQVQIQAGQALGVTVSSTDLGDVLLSYIDSPDILPVALAGATPADDPAAEEFTFPALAESPQRFIVVRRAAALPRVGSGALLFDLDYAVRSAQRTSTLSDNSRLTYEVWASPDAPADLTRRLAAAGLQIFGEQSIAAERDRLAGGAPALGLRLYLIAGGAAVALAVGAVLLAARVGAETRRYELAALRVAGVRPGVLRRGLVREYLHLTGLPFVVGLLAGVAGAALMLPGLPLVTVGTAIGELTYSPALGDVLPVAVGAMLLGLVLAMLVGLRQVGRATPDRLREGGAP